MSEALRLYPESEGNSSTAENANVEGIQHEDSGENANFVVKAKFWLTEAELSGLILLTGDTHQTELMDVELVLHKDAKSFDVRTSWKDLLTSVNTLAENNAEATKYFEKTKALKTYFRKKYPKSKVEKISKIIVTAGDDMLRDILIKSVIMDDIDSIIGLRDGIRAETSCEVVWYRRSGNDDDTGKAPDEFHPEGVTLETVGVVDPAFGRKASELVKDDVLAVKIVDSSVLGRHVARSYTTNDPSGEIPGKVLHVQNEKGSANLDGSGITKVWVQFDKEINGTFEVQQGVRLKVHVEPSDESNDVNLIDLSTGNAYPTGESKEKVVVENGDNDSLQNVKNSSSDFDSSLTIVLTLGGILGIVLGYIVMQTM